MPADIQFSKPVETTIETSGRLCFLCSSPEVALQCIECGRHDNPRLFCAQCFKVYHGHPKRQRHLQKPQSGPPGPDAVPELREDQTIETAISVTDDSPAFGISCEHCTFRNEVPNDGNNTICRMCSKTMGNVNGVSTQKEDVMETWECTICTYINSTQQRACYMCHKTLGRKSSTTEYTETGGLNQSESEQQQQTERKSPDIPSVGQRDQWVTTLMKEGLSEQQALRVAARVAACPEWYSIKHLQEPEDLPTLNGCALPIQSANSTEHLNLVNPPQAQLSKKRRKGFFLRKWLIAIGKINPEKSFTQSERKQHASRKTKMAAPKSEMLNGRGSTSRLSTRSLPSKLTAQNKEATTSMARSPVTSSSSMTLPTKTTGRGRTSKKPTCVIL